MENLKHFKDDEIVGRCNYITVRKPLRQWLRELARNLIPHREYLINDDCVLAVGPIPKRDYLTEGPILQPGDEGYATAQFEVALHRFPQSLERAVPTEYKADSCTPSHSA